ncbi:MAG TPA: hypothetical protein P5081_13390 [Phycisphaerae bacterium]|nr:hypothetical protein [Phycisphaerae bacterium]HRW53870.1 hypothetical protein [Phycisphaerae bacterium]
MFRWVCLGVATIATAILLWMVNDVRTELKRSTGIVNENLPLIFARTQRTTETLVALSDDIRQIRNLTGATDVVRDKRMAAFADHVLDTIRDSGGEIGLKPRLIGHKLKEVQPVGEWVAGARKEAIWLLVRSRSRAELVDKLCRNIYGSDWYIQFDGKDAVTLAEWLSKQPGLDTGSDGEE